METHFGVEKSSSYHQNNGQVLHPYQIGNYSDKKVGHLIGNTREYPLNNTHSGSAPSLAGVNFEEGTTQNLPTLSHAATEPKHEAGESKLMVPYQTFSNYQTFNKVMFVILCYKQCQFVVLEEDDMLPLRTTRALSICVV